MGIPLHADISGLNPQDFLNTSGIFEILEPPREMDTGRDFTQYAIKVKDTDGNEHMLNFLFDRQLSPIARAYGGEDEQLKDWVGKHLNVTAVKGKPNKDGKVFANFEFTHVEEDIVTN